jgi:heme/copper-type cytochrome/quinol oxidase subunit 2
VAADLRGDLLGAKAHLRSDWALWAGNHHTTTLIQMLTFATVAVIAAAGVVGWSAQRERGARVENERAAFMWTLSLVTTVFFIVVTIALAIPKWALHNVCV